MSITLEKPIREVDNAYTEFVKTLPCVVTGNPEGNDPMHVHSEGAGGSDYSQIPVRHNLHVESHAIGLETFAEKYNLDLQKEIHKTNVAYIKYLYEIVLYLQESRDRLTKQVRGRKKQNGI